MSEKRRDNKGRLLRQGELQRSDGKYEYRYFDVNGEKRSVYSWKLVDTDKLPKGKRDCDALRDIEKKILRDIQDGISDYRGNRTSLNRFFDEYINTKCDLKASTRTNYKYMYDKFVRGEIGNKSIASIKYSGIKRFYTSLINEKGFQPNSVKIIHAILHPIFKIAVRDGLIRINPTDGIMAEIKKGYNLEGTKRHALTEAQQSAFIEFVKNSEKYRHWLTAFTVLLGTGCRVGEFAGLRWQDCDFQEGIITIDHNLIYRQQEGGGGCTFHITTPKTKAGTRIIPMLDAVKQVLLEERIRQMKVGFNQTVIDGYSGFIFSNSLGNVLSSHCINMAIERISKDYNNTETESAKKENRRPELLPHFTVHNLRHTFCTRFCENETNLKVIQEIMGHADITTTMNIYNEATKEKKRESFANLEGKIKIC